MKTLKLWIKAVVAVVLRRVPEPDFPGRADCEEWPATVRKRTAKADARYHAFGPPVVLIGRMKRFDHAWLRRYFP